MTGQDSEADTGGLGANEPPQGMRAGGLTLPPANGSIGWPGRSSTEKLARVVQIRESWQAEELSQKQHSDLEPTPKSLPFVNGWVG